MTKFFATVCLPPTSPRKVPQAIAAIMAPYNANLTEEWNPVGHWDWWAIHSSVGNAYLVLPPHDGDQQARHGLNRASQEGQARCLRAAGRLRRASGSARLRRCAETSGAHA
ncbi:hypothetical protein [Streptomyces sp. NPDC002559]